MLKRRKRNQHTFYESNISFSSRYFASLKQPKKKKKKKKKHVERRKRCDCDTRNRNLNNKIYKAN